jgi:fructose-1,6-bisphosphatase
MLAYSHATEEMSFEKCVEAYRTLGEGNRIDANAAIVELIDNKLNTFMSQEDPFSLDSKIECILKGFIEICKYYMDYEVASSMDDATSDEFIYACHEWDLI